MKGRSRDAGEAKSDWWRQSLTRAFPGVEEQQHRACKQLAVSLCLVHFEIQHPCIILQRSLLNQQALVLPVLPLRGWDLPNPMLVGCPGPCTLLCNAVLRGSACGIEGSGLYVTSNISLCSHHENKGFFPFGKCTCFSGGPATCDFHSK